MTRCSKNCVDTERLRYGAYTSMRAGRSIFPRAVATSAVVFAIAACSGTSASIGPDAIDATDATDAASPDAGGPDATLMAGGGSDSGEDAAPVGCGAFAGDTKKTCSADGMSLGDCVDGGAAVIPCPDGCLREDASTDDICMGTSADWSCKGSFSTSKQQNGHYYLTSFGCWVDDDGTKHSDPGDNCVPACQSELQKTAYCAGLSGPSCEEAVNWYVADSGRFGCGAHLRVTNPESGMSVIVLVIDEGPSCDSVEDKVDYGVLDASGRVDEYLFGAQKGYSDKAKVTVVEVDESYPLGPE